MYMGLIQDLRNKRNQRSHIERNSDTLRKELQRDLPREELEELISLMDEPEVHEPLFEHLEALGRQPGLDSALRTQFRVKTARVLGDDKDQARLHDVFDRFDEATNTYSNGQNNNRLSDRLQLSGRDDPLTFTERMRQRIKETRQEFNDRVDYQKQKITQGVNQMKENVQDKAHEASNAVERRVQPVVGMVQDNVRGLVHGVKNRVQSFKDDYRVRKLAVENAQNWEKALENGVDAEQIQDAIDHAGYPEVQHGLMKHADKLFEQDAMTPDLAKKLYFAVSQNVERSNPLYDHFNEHVSNYADSVVDYVPTLADIDFDNEVVGEPSEEDKQIATTTLMQYELGRRDLDTTVDSELQEMLDERLTFEGYNNDGENVWRYQLDDGESFAINDAMAGSTAMSYYKTMRVRKEHEQTEVEGLHVEAEQLDSVDEESFLSPYGSNDNVHFENSQMAKRLQEAHNLHTLPEVETGNGLDIRQAQLLGMEGDEAIWGVPDNGEIKHLTDSELEEAFADQYKKPIEDANKIIEFPQEQEDLRQRERERERELPEGAKHVEDFEKSESVKTQVEKYLKGKNPEDVAAVRQSIEDQIELEQVDGQPFKTMWAQKTEDGLKPLSDQDRYDLIQDTYQKQQESVLESTSESEPSFFDRQADAFNQVLDEEEALMSQPAPPPSEQDAPPLPDEHDAPPLSFDGLDEQEFLQEM